jgi:hypothetical protein
MTGEKNCKSVVNMLASIGSKAGDAHGNGGRPVSLAPPSISQERW